MILKNPNDYIFSNYRVSHTKNKKYDAILINKYNMQPKIIPFGDSRYPQYQDRTGLQVYSHLDHLDKKRRELYHLRHAKDIKNKFSSGWFSYYLLW